jgi:hypothetical protein
MMDFRLRDDIQEDRRRAVEGFIHGRIQFHRRFNFQRL